VYVNSRKFACGSCIKGHRSSSCYHTDRPLFEIKKKGRPVSQCTKCRDLRKNKRMHVKCSCIGTSAPGPSSIGLPVSMITPHVYFSLLDQRKLPAIPTLPNGIKDLVADYTPSIEANPKQRVAHLLNPCKCRSLRDCRCAYASSSRMPSVDPPSNQDHANLDHSNVASPDLASFSTPDLIRGLVSQQNVDSQPQFRARTQPSLISEPTQLHMPNHIVSSFENETMSLPSVEFSSNTSLRYIPRLFDFQMLPSLEEVPDSLSHHGHGDAQLDKCGCGNICACPGCKEHRGPSASDISGEDCPENCSFCVDRASGLALPSIPSSVIKSHSKSSNDFKGSSSHGSTPSAHANIYMSPLEEFHTVAALIPPPPASRAPASGTLDATNLNVYQTNKSSNWQKAVGLVQLPRLKCCGGRCRCPRGECGCHSECHGQCRPEQLHSEILGSGSVAEMLKASRAIPDSEVNRRKSCCYSKRKN
ncbi:hypothetical protein BU17DRAFT_42300, partial [Hysterangium stoloniferum]